jgi:hypothetical protein
MRLNKIALIGLAALVASNAQAANQSFNVPYRMAIIEDGQLMHQNLHRAYGFRVEILNDDEGVKPESFKNGRPSITASKGERYSVRLYNPLPVRVAVNLTVDGLNSISGKASGISDGQKWMIEPYSSITIPGWQISGGESRRFFFTEKPKSYAKWRGDVTGQDLAANCGVIGAAYFWNQQELDDYYDNHPLYRNSQAYMRYPEARVKKQSMFSADGAMANASSAAGMSDDFSSMKSAMPSAPPPEQAGTGMGERESHPTTEVAFNYNTGMYSLDQAVVIYYDFAQAPNPFPEQGYAPEMR